MNKLLFIRICFYCFVSDVGCDFGKGDGEVVFDLVSNVKSDHGLGGAVQIELRQIFVQIFNRLTES